MVITKKLGSFVFKWSDKDDKHQKEARKYLTEMFGDSTCDLIIDYNCYLYDNIADGIIEIVSLDNENIRFSVDRERFNNFLNFKIHHLEFVSES